MLFRSKTEGDCDIVVETQIKLPSKAGGEPKFLDELREALLPSTQSPIVVLRNIYGLPMIELRFSADSAKTPESNGSDSTPAGGAGSPVDKDRSR